MATVDELLSRLNDAERREQESYAKFERAERRAKRFEKRHDRCDEAVQEAKAALAVGLKNQLGLDPKVECDAFDHTRAVMVGGRCFLLEKATDGPPGLLVEVRFLGPPPTA